MTVRTERVMPVVTGEGLPSQEVYAAVIKEALQYNVMEGEEGSRKSEYYRDMDVQRVHLERSASLGAHRVWDADQTVQRTGAYKDRAAAGAMLATPDNVRAGHVASAGNAGAAYARAADRRGMDMTVHCTTTASAVKLARCVGYGAKVNATYADLEQAQAGAYAQSKAPVKGPATRSTLFHPFDNESVIAGNATAGFEMIADLQQQHAEGSLNVYTDPIKLFVPVGGGGLIAGVAVAVKWAKEQGYLGADNVQIIGVQMEGCDAMKRTVDYLRAGQTPPKNLFNRGLPFNANSDGTAVRKPGKLTTTIVADADLVQEIMLVSQEELGWEMLRKYQETGTKYEPAGMLARTGAKKYAAQHTVPETLVTVTSGANVSDGLFEKMTTSGKAHMEAQWAAERRDGEEYRRKMYALGKTMVKPAHDVSEPLRSRRSAHRGRAWSGTFPRS